VAVAATEPLVSAAQREAGLRRMVEAPEAPSVRVVALAAGAAEVATVSVVVLVTSVAVAACVFVSRGEVTLLTRHHRVESQQGESRQIVIEEDSCVPRFLAVTAAAFRALLAAVHIVVSVAALAAAAELLFL